MVKLQSSPTAKINWTALHELQGFTYITKISVPD